MAMREAADNLEGVIGGDQGLPAEHTAQGFALRGGPVGQIGQCPAFDLPILPVAFAQQDGGWRETVGNGGDVHASIVGDEYLNCMDQICLTCLRMEGKIEAIPLCDKSLRASRWNNFGLSNYGPGVGVSSRSPAIYLARKSRH